MILNKSNPETIQTISSLIKFGAVAVLPCDTIYGLSSLYGIGEKPLKELKGRDANKPFLILATLEQAKEMCNEIPQDIIDSWPGPLTVILNTKKDGKVAIRVPKDPFLNKLLENIGSPVYSTSVNMSGEPSLLDFESIRNRFEALVDVIVKGQDVQGTVPSTLIDATVLPYKLIRQGAYDVADLIAKSGLNADAPSK